MRRKHNKLCLRLLNIPIALAALPILVACYNEEIDTLSLNMEPEPVYIHVSADILGDLNATRATDPYAVEGEFMNTLCVFVVDEAGKIEAKFGPDILEGYTAAQTGDLTDWTSDRLTLSAGTKTIYAFSNWDNTGSTEWANLIAKGVGGTITSSDLNFTVYDPASKVDIANGQYIPMSGKATAVVSSGSDLNYNQLIDVGMDRLVGKVTISINGETGNGAKVDTLGILTFSGWADKVPMMSDNAPTYDVTYDGYYSNELNQPIGIDETKSIASFYVNETFRPSTGLGYEITLDTDRYGGTYYTATTERLDIQRNYIYPITLTLDQNVLDLAVTAWTDPLGIEEVPYYNITVNDNTYYITLLDVTSTFQIAPSMVYKGTKVSDTTWTWTYVDTSADKPSWSVDSNGAITVTQLTATPGYEYGFTLLATWTVGTTTHTRTYNFFVGFVDGWPQFSAPAQSTWRTNDTRSEVVNLLLNK